jgi:hypothetical protein
MACVHAEHREIAVDVPRAESLTMAFAELALAI